VENHPAGVEIEIEGDPRAIDSFLAAMKKSPPPLSLITGIITRERTIEGEAPFRIRQSSTGGGKTALISPDIATCPDCLKELFDPADRRYRYPFINCTNCGPRFTIVTDIPYDRTRTTMEPFPMCPRCRREYDNPSDRRFHAQPNACPVCGPKVTFLDAAGVSADEARDPIAAAATVLLEGRIVAIRGLGGFHLAVCATSEAAVRRLRSRKRREEKPLAVMARGIEQARELGEIDFLSEALLTGLRRPIVLVPRKEGSPLSDAVAPGNPFIGLMLPYTPLHHLLCAEPMPPLVMTSGNLSEEPLCMDNAEAVERLSGIADAFLVHDREIRSRCDDTVVRVTAGAARLIRRSRGYVPQPVPLSRDLGEVLSVGAMLKNTVCLTKGRFAFLSQHIGDLENLETADYLADTIGHLCRLLEVRPRLIACDLHPDYLSTRFALEQTELPVVRVQHHHAHAAAAMAEHGLDGPVIGVSFDGTGLGEDGAVWGGEFLIADQGSFRRIGHLDYRPLPGGEKAIREPWRMLLAYTAHLPGTDLASLLDGHPWEALLSALSSGVGSVPTSSAGRLFDGVSALTGFPGKAAFEGQAAMLLEEMVDCRRLATAGPYPFDTAAKGEGTFRIGLDLLWEALLEERRRETSRSTIATRFHATMAAIVLQGALRAREATGIGEVVLSGGVFQNASLLGECLRILPQAGFAVYAHERVPTNDGGLCLGQALVGATVNARG
jgi:hydrogenase maturation protein HypF